MEIIALELTALKLRLDEAKRERRGMEIIALELTALKPRCRARQGLRIQWRS